MQVSEFLRGDGRHPSMWGLEEFHLNLWWGKRYLSYVKLCSEMPRSDGFVLRPRNCSLSPRTDPGNCCVSDLLPHEPML